MRKTREIVTIMIALAGLVSAIQPAAAERSYPEPMSLHKLLDAFGWHFDKAEIRAEKVDDDFYVLFGLGGNIALSIGEDGTLIVDDQFPELIPQIKARIKKLGGGDVDFVINTHWHFDHADGNQALGPDGSRLIAQANSRRMMLDDHVINLVGLTYNQKAYPPSALPTFTYDDTMQIHLNGGQIDLMHFGAAHTTGDTAIIFREHNAVHLGDVYNNTGYPFIDADNGGSLEGIIAFCQATLAELNRDSIVIPGHGPISDYQGLQNYISILSSVRDRMKKMIREGADLDAIEAAKITAEWDAKMGDPAGFIDRSYVSLTK
jgi:glyoxylase-like metal-dependent hydrolase (beta-lactamase superfamily II)|tara:strand:- start:639 stop:1595 length:957 start_codon:yes stop_codon:yes gene_type:complete